MTNEPDRAETDTDATGAEEGPSALDPGRVSAFLAELACAPDRDPEAALRALRPGAVVGKFELVREIGRGGFGVVYEAIDRELSRRVAFKAIRPGRRAAAFPAAAATEDAWLRQEAEAAAQLAHPNIVTLHDLGTSEDGPYLVLELLRGETLSERLRRGPLQPREALRISVEVARALAHAHAAGVLHRDLKPQNVFLCDDGAVKVLDFGLAHVLGTAPRRGGGTPGYMAPEQWRKESEDERTDIFAAAVLLHEMLSGELPYPVAADRSAVLEPGPTPVLRRPGVPRTLSALVAAGLSKEPAGRPRNAQTWLDGLFAAERALARPRRRARLLGAALVVAAALAAGGYWLLRPAPEPGERVAISVADFANDTDERDLSGLSGMLVTSLEQSRRLAVMTRSRMLDVLKQIGREPPERIDEPLAREIGRRAGVRALLLASIRRFDRVYSIELRALDPTRDEYLFTLREEGEGKAGIPAMIDRLSERTRRAFREPSPEIRGSVVRVAEAITPNLQAYQHYFLGLDCMDRPSRYPSHPLGCLDEFRKAVAVDPDFALAWLHLSRAGWQELTPTEEDRAAIARALRLVDRVPPKERALIRAWGAHLEGRDDEAIALYRQITASFPEDKQALYLAGDLLWHRDDLAAAVPYLEGALRLDPSLEFALDHLSYSLAVLGRREDLAGWVRSWSGMAPTPAVFRALVQGRLGLGEVPPAVATARQALKVGSPSFALSDLARALSFGGDYAVLESEIRSREPGLPVNYRYWLAHALAARGRRAEARRVLDDVERRPPGEDARRDVRYIRAVHLEGDGDAAGVWAEAQALLPIDAGMAGWLAVHLARLGDLVHAGELAGHLPAGSPLRELYVAASEWREGRLAHARARLKALEEAHPLPRGGLAPAFLRAEVAADEGLDAEVVEALRRFERLPLQPYWRSWAYPRSLFLLARSLERLGRPSESRIEVDRLLRLWSGADPGLPLLAEARALAARLPPSPAREAPGRGRSTPPAGGGSPNGFDSR